MKKPLVIRCPLNGGLTGESAYQWALFLADEADMSDDGIAYDKWKRIAEQLAPEDNKPVPSSVHYRYLEKEIEKWNM